ncbi:hypothetical protein [Methylotenera sp. 1P/1]|uniref:hypothetical protein n=1 Tax=Methylotenera sp. 1P/1 TaxID=1131551 RepID=UPI00037E3890|nr:hypothetical protein [Methylotenera sp. 1P/1]
MAELYIFIILIFSEPSMLFLVFLAIAFLIIIVFCLACIFQPVKWAIRSTLIFVSSAVSSIILSGIFVYFIVGLDKVLTPSSWAASLNGLPFPVISGLIGGGLVLWLYFKNRRSNPSFKRDWLKPAP